MVLKSLDEPRAVLTMRFGLVMYDLSVLGYILPWVIGLKSINEFLFLLQRGYSGNSLKWLTFNYGQMESGFSCLLI